MSTYDFYLPSLKKKMYQGLWSVGITNHFNFLPYIYILKNFISKGTNKREKNPMEFTIELNLDNSGWSIFCQCTYAEYIYLLSQHLLFHLLDGKLISVS